jgi:hypothetical protein
MSGRANVKEEDRLDELEGLLRRLAAIGEEIERNRRHLEHLAAEFDRVDSAIRAASLAPAPFHEKSVPNMVLDILADAEGPMSAKEIAMGVMALQGGRGADTADLKQLTHRVCVSLWVQNQKGLVQKIEAAGSRFRWQRRVQ